MTSSCEPNDSHSRSGSRWQRMGARQGRKQQWRRTLTEGEALRSYEKLLFLKAAEEKPELELLSLPASSFLPTVLPSTSSKPHLLAAYNRHHAGKYRPTIDDTDRLEHNCTRGM